MYACVSDCKKPNVVFLVSAHGTKPDRIVESLSHFIKHHFAVIEKFLFQKLNLSTWLTIFWQRVIAKRNEFFLNKIHNVQN